MFRFEAYGRREFFGTLASVLPQTISEYAHIRIGCFQSTVHAQLTFPTLTLCKFVYSGRKQDGFFQSPFSPPRRDSKRIVSFHSSTFFTILLMMKGVSTLYTSAFCGVSVFVHMSPFSCSPLLNFPFPNELRIYLKVSSTTGFLNSSYFYVRVRPVFMVGKVKFYDSTPRITRNYYSSTPQITCIYLLKIVESTAS